MPPLPGIFPVPFAPTHISNQNGIASVPNMASTSGPGVIGPGIGIGSASGKNKSGPAHAFIGPDSGEFAVVNGHGVLGHGHAARHAAEERKDKKRKEVSNKVSKEINDRRDDTRNFTENVSQLATAAHIMATRPDSSPMFRLRLYPLSLERSALLAQFENEERYARECAKVAYDEERSRVEEQWKKGHDRVRERLLEGIEERRKRAREEKEGEGTVVDAALDAHVRQPITRKLRNKLGTSPPPTPLATSVALPALNSAPGKDGAPSIPAGPFLNPHSLAVDEIPTPFPLPLASRVPSTSGAAAAATTTVAATKRKPKAAGKDKNEVAKSLIIFFELHQGEIESDLGELRRGNKRRRAAAAAAVQNGQRA